ncbi:decaprenyl-phosphate phosphoribosyltransferase [Phycicoccus sp. MAQZ13P-2]|uniref:decaprenyl-phosphate phosphoribosyltransferase n=1 Tax=Phycicoccus mangrovi TaxID=2840470 RepID=UPI001C00576B|nr:decaprenyl-phosphate phosphoribosyltransferase [Phycicoccus mangrovi]MBT9257147.1 decaprenyl-phosphate phosphoribosyltransferase [Phycicoccus mangrovi]MBT9276354.1 decaprenyl-phosphate phosphoribosyltransferase [Phycicoccus mangrovi]
MAFPTLSTTAADPAPAHVRGRPMDLLRLIRPMQWPKNLLVIAAPAAGGVLDQGGSVARSLVAVLAFTAASASVYAVNDVVDATADREHPTKRMRPVASGRIAPRTALTTAALAATLSAVLAGATGWATLVVVLTYLALSAGYALKLKHVAVLDIVVVATGFVLRALAGATATEVTVSSWFLLVSLFGALYLVAAKRAAEAARELIGTTRTVLAQYPREWLNQVVGVALTGALLAYAMWAFQDVGTDVFVPALAGSVGPFLVALLRYGLLVANGGGEAPERDLMTDRTLLLAGAAWATLVGVGVYAG